MNENEKLIEDQLRTLPEPLQKAISMVPWRSAVKEIALSHKLSLPQISALDQETMLIVYGFDDPRNYIDNLVREVGIDEDTAVSIAESVNEKIFQKISQKAEEMEGVSHDNLPMVEPGEVAHEVPHMEAKPEVAAPPAPVQPASAPAAPPASPAPEPVVPAPQAPAGPVKTRPHSDTRPEKPASPTPDYRYPGGADPYREPIQ